MTDAEGATQVSVKRKDSGDNKAPPPKRSFISGLQGYKSKDGNKGEKKNFFST